MEKENIEFQIKKLANPAKAKILTKFFKTEPGQYGAGDKFLGLTVPQTRKIANQFDNLPINQISTLIHSPFHEIRLATLLILIKQFEKSAPKNQKNIYHFYLKNIRSINNWDLIDLSAPKIIGAYIFKHTNKKSTLIQLAKSKNLWEKRIAMLATYTFIKNNQFTLTLKLAKILISDDHDLIHKAVGWMLREVGNRNQKVEETFLKKNYKKMPRTMLRYAIEKFPPPLRHLYLKGKIF